MKIDKDKIKEVVDLLYQSNNHTPSDVAISCNANEELVTIIIEAYQWCRYHSNIAINDLKNAHKTEIKTLQHQVCELTQFKLDTAEKFIYGNTSKEFVISNT